MTHPSPIVSTLKTRCFLQSRSYLEGSRVRVYASSPLLCHALANCYCRLRCHCRCYCRYHCRCSWASHTYTYTYRWKRLCSMLITFLACHVTRASTISARTRAALLLLLLLLLRHQWMALLPSSTHELCAALGSHSLLAMSPGLGTSLEWPPSSGLPPNARPSRSCVAPTYLVAPRYLASGLHIS